MISPYEVVSTTTTGGEKRKEPEPEQQKETEEEKMAQREGEGRDASKKPRVEVLVPCQEMQAYRNARLPWWDADESVESKIRRIEQCMQMQRGEPMNTFRQRMEVIALWIANAMEKTAVDQAGDTYRILSELQARPNQDDDIHAHPWTAEGGNNRNETSAQMKCHLRASQYLMRQSVLTNEAILKAHAILMHGAVDEYGNHVLAGTYRNHPSHNGAGFVYVEPNDIPRRMCDSVNDIAIGSDEADVLVVCHATARFVHAFLITHPFQNGNGRMARLIASYLLQKAGAPFIVPITNGHRKNRQHYLRALKAADRGQYTQLVLYILECYARTCDNAINAIQNC